MTENTQLETAQREGTLETADVKIFKFALWLKRNGKAENTIKMRSGLVGSRR